MPHNPGYAHAGVPGRFYFYRSIRRVDRRRRYVYDPVQDTEFERIIFDQVSLSPGRFGQIALEASRTPENSTGISYRHLSLWLTLSGGCRFVGLVPWWLSRCRLEEQGRSWSCSGRRSVNAKGLQKKGWSWRRRKAYVIRHSGDEEAVDGEPGAG